MTWSLATAVAAADWEVRYAHLHDQNPEWTESGINPAWQIRQRDGEVTWQDEDKGD